MSANWKRQWRALREARPGERFQKRYRSANRDEKGASPAGHIVRVGLAILAAVVGVVLVVMPGPAVLFFALAGALMASESLWVARALDWTEVKGRTLGAAAWRWWRARTGAAKVAVAGAMVAVAGGAAYGAWQWVRD